MVHTLSGGIAPRDHSSQDGMGAVGTVAVPWVGGAISTVLTAMPEIFPRTISHATPNMNTVITRKRHEKALLPRIGLLWSYCSDTNSS